METQTPTNKIPSKRFRIKKNGEVSEYDQKKYNKTWYELHKDEVLKQRIECPCGLSHLFSNKSNHRAGRVHKLWVLMNSKLEGGEKAFLGKGYGSLVPIDLVEIAKPAKPAKTPADPNRQINCLCGLSHLASSSTNHRAGRVHKLWVKLNSKLEGGLCASPTEVVEDLSPPIVLNTNLYYSTLAK